MRKNEVKHNNTHAQMEKKMTKSQIIMEFEACFNDDSLLKCEPVNSMNLILSFFRKIAHYSRSKRHRMEGLEYDFLKDFPGIRTKGHVASCVFGNGGKLMPPKH